MITHGGLGTVLTFMFELDFWRGFRRFVISLTLVPRDMFIPQEDTVTQLHQEPCPSGNGHSTLIHKAQNLDTTRILLRLPTLW